MMRSTCLFIVLLAVASTASSKPQPRTPPSAVKAAQQRVAMMLRDPDSAKFSESFPGNEGAVCGIVNAKNAMGGYAGPRRFISTKDRVIIESEDGSTAFDYRWLELCEEIRA